jgi:hypothetical protein
MERQSQRDFSGDLAGPQRRMIQRLQSSVMKRSLHPMLSNGDGVGAP